MRSARLALAGAAVGVQLLAGCLLFPEVKDRVVELATGGAVILEWHAQGDLNAFTATQTVDLRNYVNIPQLLADSGIEPADVKRVTLSGVSYRIAVPDSTPGRTIGGTIQVARGGGSLVTLVDGFTAAADAPTGWITLVPDPAGVAVLNDVFSDVLAELHGGPTANETVTCRIAGTSQPSDVPADFVYQLRLTVSIVGAVRVKTLE